MSKNGVNFLSKTAKRIMSFNIRPIVLSGPSGGGKSTILKRAMDNYTNCFAFSVSHTTRNARPGEAHGIDYYFTKRDEMEKMIKNGEFLEHAEFGGNIYGTSKQVVKDICSSGKICVLDVELQGVKNIKKANLNPTPKYVMIQAPSINALKQRLTARGTETPESIELRVKHAEEDLETVQKDPHLFDHVIVNDNLERAYIEFVTIIKEEIDEVQSIKKTNGC